MKGVKKQHLPSKLCLVCGRTFTWRKKWEKVWEEVKFCSEHCRRHKAGAPEAKLGDMPLLTETASARSR
jgi:hypothetical protein